MRVLGVDPGLRTTGYGVVEALEGRLRLVEAGVLRPRPELSLERRLSQLHEGMVAVLEATAPEWMVVEELWSAPRHPATAVLMGHARGVIALAAGRCAVAFDELPHAAVKRALTGHGAARKAQVKAMVCTRLGLSVVPEPDDVSDALALALVYLARAHDPVAAAVAASTVMDRAQKHRAMATTPLRGRTGGPTQRVGGAQPGAERG